MVGGAELCGTLLFRPPRVWRPFGCEIRPFTDDFISPLTRLALKWRFLGGNIHADFCDCADTNCNYGCRCGGRPAADALQSTATFCPSLHLDRVLSRRERRRRLDDCQFG